ncbi:MAG: hypothetical protein WCG73_02885 [Candidatus Moraniibacteriota bacterium]
MYEEFPIGKSGGEDFGAETADEAIFHVEELLDDGLYDKESCDEAIVMLNATRLLTEDHQAREQIDVLLSDIESRYGESK